MGAGPSHAVDLAQRLIRCPSVTPHEGGALDLLEAELTALGFACTRLPFGEGDERIDNLFARIGDAGRICALPAIRMWFRSATRPPGRMALSMPRLPTGVSMAVVPPT